MNHRGYPLPKPTNKSKIEDRVYFDTKYGGVTIHQKGIAAKQLTITPTDAACALENVRLSMHVERYEAVEPFLEDIECITRFPEFDREFKHEAPCRMRIGQTHGCAAVPSTTIPLDFENVRDTMMEIEYKRGEESLATHTIQVKFCEAPLVTKEDN